jgi:hypothetical protein
MNVPQPHVDYCRKEAEIVTLTLDMKVVKGQLQTMLQSQMLIEHALLGTLTDTERKGLLEEHHEHHKTLFGDKHREGDKGLVGEVHNLRGLIEKARWTGAGAAAAFGLVGSAVALIGTKAIAAFLSMGSNGK